MNKISKINNLIRLIILIECKLCLSVKWKFLETQILEEVLVQSVNNRVFKLKEYHHNYRIRVLKSCKKSKRQIILAKMKSHEAFNHLKKMKLKKIVILSKQ